MSLTNDGRHFVLENLRSSEVIDSFAASSATVIHTIGGVFKTPSQERASMIVTFYYEAGELKIIATDIFTSTRYKLYKEAAALPIIIDAFSYSEAGVGVIYFTDNVNEPRKLRCEIPVSYSDWFLTEFDLSLTRRGAAGSVTLDSITTGGNLLSGSYQFAYRSISPATNKFTKWSLLSNPIQVYTSNTASSIITAGVGLPTAFKIIVDINPSAAEIANYTHVQLAVVENIFPTGTPTTSAVLTPYIEMASRSNYSYVRSPNYEVTDISNLTIDFQPIAAAKTLATKQNKLVLGNITYANLDYDSGTPEVTSGSILKAGYLNGGTSETTWANSASEHGFISTHKGYFRDEVYRFAISYFDKYGNYSSPVALDMSNVTRNQSSQSGFKDMKFPARNQFFGGDPSLQYTLFKSGGAGVYGGTMQLGLQLTIDNHPTWAVGFVILRVKRIKNIQFQSPLVPMGTIAGVGAIQNYPTKSKEGNPVGDVTYTSPQPMEQATLLHPMNYFRSGVTYIYRDNSTSGAGINKKFTNEVFISSDNFAQYHMLFPNSYLSGSKEFDMSGYKIQSIDAALLRCRATDATNGLPAATTVGNFIDSSISGTFYALDPVQYYCSSDKTAGQSNPRSALDIKKSVFVDNLSEGKLLNTLSIMSYDVLETKEGGNTSGWGYRPAPQKAQVIDLGTTINFANILGLSFVGGATAYASGTGLTNDYNTHTGASVPTTYPNIVEIVNVVSNLSDDRYGNRDARHEFISTGAIHTFSAPELANVAAGTSQPITIDVWGGDCYVGAKLYKITDSHYSVTNAEKTSGTSATIQQVADRWKRAYLDISDTSPLRVPVAVRNCAQYLQIVIESEENPEVMDVESITSSTTYNVIGASSNFPILEAVNEVTFRTPLTYDYNYNISKENEDKLFFSKDPNIPVISNYKSRIVFSDDKIYQSTIEGFDLFRTLNFFDLDESYGRLNKLIISGDNLYSVQDSAINYLPVGQRVLETTDALALAVGSGDFINQPVQITNKFGGQNARAVIDGTNGFFVLDFHSASIIQVSGNSFKQVDSGIASLLRFAVNAYNGSDISTEEALLYFIYDAKRRELVFCGPVSGYLGQFGHVYNEDLGKWTTYYSFSGVLQSGCSVGSKFIIVGSSGSSLYIEELHAGFDSNFQTARYGTVFGAQTSPAVSFVVNDQVDQPKIFDNVVVTSTNPPTSMTNLVRRNSSLSSLSNTVNFSAVPYNEGNYETKLLLDQSTGQRLRGTILEATMRFDPVLPTIVRSVLTKYRPARTI